LVTNFASGEEAVGAIFDGDKVKHKVDAPAEGSNTKSNSKKPKRGKKGKKKGPPNQHGQEHEEDSDKVLIVAPDSKGPWGPPRGSGGPFDDMLKKPCPYHKGRVNHTLEECHVLCKYFNRLGRKDKAKKEKDEDDKGGDVYPSVENMFFIFGGSTANMNARQRKRERREVFSVTRATPA
jgi:hypothetical protein